jgi:hypothetical protein
MQQSPVPTTNTLGALRHRISELEADISLINALIQNLEHLV